MKQDWISVTVLCSYVHNIFIAEELLHNISVCGEVSGIKISRGHAYFTLKDSNAQISCCCFNCAKTYVPKDGESVIVKGSMDFYEKGGRLSLNADSIVPYGAGLIALQLEQLKARLTEQGYFDSEHKKSIKKFCNNVCVLTSTSGAVIRDIITTVRRLNNVIDITVYGVQVQGALCAQSIIKALGIVDELGFDAIIIARGGGSAEDLMPFNDENLVKKIYACKTPIISAVGHETDYTFCDLVADCRAATPTAAAQLIAYDVEELKEYLSQFGETMISKLSGKTEYSKEKLIRLTSQLCSKAQAVNRDANYRLSENIRGLFAAWERKSERCKNAVNQYLTRLSAVNPAQVLQRGFFGVSKDGNKLTGVSSLQKGDNITVMSHDGEAVAVVDKVTIR